MTSLKIPFHIFIYVLSLLLFGDNISDHADLGLSAHPVMIILEHLQTSTDNI